MTKIMDAGKLALRRWAVSSLDLDDIRREVHRAMLDAALNEGKE